MSDYHNTEAELDKLDLMIREILQRGGLHADWRPVWAQIKSVGVSFKGVRFPTRDDHQRAWDRFQKLVSRVKEEEDIERQAQQQRCAELDRDLTELVLMLPRWLADGNGRDWKSIWGRINQVKSLFKNVRYPTRDERDRAWHRLQNLEAQATEASEKERNSQARECVSLGKQIDDLEFMLPGWFSVGAAVDWKAVWVQIRQLSASFKEVRFPTQEAREQAWNKFQKMVARVKEAQAEEQGAWEKKRSNSQHRKDEILSLARAAEPSTGSEELAVVLATGGLSLIVKVALNEILGPFDERKAELQRCGASLKSGWDLLREYRDEMFGTDRQLAFTALKSTQDKLDAAWDAYKRDRGNALARHGQESEQKRANWLDRVNQNMAKLEDRREKLSGVLSHKESHLSELYDQQRGAWSDDFRSRVSGWIEEEEKAIEDIKEKLHDIEDWIVEERDKLRR